MDKLTTPWLTAPCGMNCALCMAYQRSKNHCPGCRGDDTLKSKYCVSCIIINCEKRKGKEADFCFVCDSFPCRRIKDLDKRYRTKYSMSMLENLEYIRRNGIDAFAANENERWKCESCGGLICVHRGYCFSCADKKEAITRE